MPSKILVIGSTGQVGTELTALLRQRYGAASVIAGVYGPESSYAHLAGPKEAFDVTDRGSLKKAVAAHGVETIYHLGGILSAAGELNPDLAWRVNLDGLKNVLDVSVAAHVTKVFWPSSIAVYGPSAPRTKTPQGAPLAPTTVYGVTKVAGELLCNYYFRRFGLDTRVIRYPGLVSSMTPPGGGTTDYTVAMFHAALHGEPYSCYLRRDTVLPMMYMPDALEATLAIMEADGSRVPTHTGYNIAATSFSAGELAEEIGRRIPGFRCVFEPDSRQEIADSWPMSVDDSEARRDWGWSHRYGLKEMAEDMIAQLSARAPGQKSG
jgi:nucleoside-diphosphate-sugar epimerase